MTRDLENIIEDLKDMSNTINGNHITNLIDRGIVELELALDHMHDMEYEEREGRG